jgi:hypothetical protein
MSTEKNNPGQGHGQEHEPQGPKDKEYKIIVSGVQHPWDKEKISFKEVIILAYKNYVDAPTMVYTVSYEDGPKENRDGSLEKNQSVYVKNNMIFHATAADES